LVLLPAQAGVAIDVQDILAVSKFAGACGVMQQMVAFQTTTKMQGGDEFIARFWTTEFARLGKSKEAFIAQCEGSVSAYDKWWAQSEEGRK
jgi:hypothetical protein